MVGEGGGERMLSVRDKSDVLSFVSKNSVELDQGRVFAHTGKLVGDHGSRRPYSLKVHDTKLQKFHKKSCTQSYVHMHSQD